MSEHVVVREYARLSVAEPNAAPMQTLDHARISASAFAYLCQLMGSFKKNGATLLVLENQYSLKLDNYVGILSTPCGTVIEILPKLTEHGNQMAQDNARRILIKMLGVALDLPYRSASKAALQSWELPLQEWVMQEFVRELALLVKRGLRFDYKVVQSEQRFLQGQLDVARQMRQSPGRRHLFPLRHDVFLPDNAENRLLKSALMVVCASTRHSTIWRDAHALATLFADIAPSQNKAADLRAWRTTRLMTHYRAVRPWCELVLGQSMPVALSGSTQGISLLFPMEKLFERYVEQHLQKHLQDTEYHIARQEASRHLCILEQKPMFSLRPDMLLRKGHQICMVLDAKWKLLFERARGSKLGLQSSDFYQMFAYGHKYLNGTGEMMLIYPKTAAFSGDMEETLRFEFAATTPGLGLWVVGFDLDSDIMIWPQQLGIRANGKTAFTLTPTAAPSYP